MRAEDAHEDIKSLAKDADDRRTRWTALYISVLAVMLAIASLGGSNASKDMINNNIEAANYWSFFQAKNVRQTAVALAADELALPMASRPEPAPETRAQFEQQIARHRATVARYESDPREGDGKKELAAKARAHEAARRTAQAKDPYFDYSQAFLQIGIVLASVSLVTASRLLPIVSLGLSAAGALLMLNGFLLLFRLGLLEG